MENLKNEFEIFIKEKENENNNEVVVIPNNNEKGNINIISLKSFNQLEKDLKHLLSLKERMGVILNGDAGNGKTYLILSILKYLKIEKKPYINLDMSGDAVFDYGNLNEYIFIKGNITSSELYVCCYINRNRTIIIDDADSFMGTAQGNNLLKSLLDTTTNNVSWQTRRPIEVNYKNWQRQDKKETIASNFEFNGRVIIISNKQNKMFDSAILSRCYTFNAIKTKEEIKNDILTLRKDILCNFDEGEQLELIDIVFKNYLIFSDVCNYKNNTKIVTIRTFYKLNKLYGNRGIKPTDILKLEIEKIKEE